jgi:hypothetical protein
MVSPLDYLVRFEEHDASGLVGRYDKEDSMLRGYEGDYSQTGKSPLAELDATDARPVQTLSAEALAG